MVPSNTIGNDVLEVETGEKKTKAMVLNCTLLRCLERCLEMQKEKYQLYCILLQSLKTRTITCTFRRYLETCRAYPNAEKVLKTKTLTWKF